MIYLDSSALLKFVKRESQSASLRAWREGLPAETELATSELARLEISRTLLHAGVDVQRVPYVTDQALRGLYLIDLTSSVLARARAYRTRRLGSLDAVHLATADPFLADTTGFVTYDVELGDAATELGFPALAPC